MASEKGAGGNPIGPPRLASDRGANRAQLDSAHERNCDPHPRGGSRDRKGKVETAGHSKDLPRDAHAVERGGGGGGGGGKTVRPVRRRGVLRQIHTPPRG